jgi:hypothetical protein
VDLQAPLHRVPYCVVVIRCLLLCKLYFSPDIHDLKLLLLLLLLLLTAIELSVGGSSPYTSTDKTNKNKRT